MLCRQCKKDFYSNRSYQIYCKSKCRSETRPAYFKKWREKNIEHKKNLDKQYYLKLISTPEGLEKHRQKIGTGIGKKY